MTTLEIRPLWFSPKCMCTRTLCSQSYEHLENKITLLGPNGGLISEVPLYYGFPFNNHYTCVNIDRNTTLTTYKGVTGVTGCDRV